MSNRFGPLAVLALAGGILTTASAGAATFVVRVPATTPAGSSIWISGDLPELGSWNGAGVKLERAADGSWTKSIALPEGAPFEFKVTRGSWDTVEKDSSGGEIANHTATTSEGSDTLRIEVATWRDQTETRAARVSTLTGDVRRHAAFRSKFVPARDVLVWLPPGYERETRRRYPVVYFHDGQNVMDGATSFLPGQEWGADETADRLIRAKRMPPVILVTVANTAARMDEYTSAADARRGGGNSGAYFRFLVEELLPFVNRTYRTDTLPSRTAVIGSSLGGLAALDLGFAHPERFGLVGCISPAVWWADSAIVKRVRASAKKPLRIRLDIGTAESVPSAEGRRTWLDHVRLLRDALLERGWREGFDLEYEEVDGAAHNERAWAARLDRILEYLFATR